MHDIVGSISQGTLLVRDLIPTFAIVLLRLDVDDRHNVLLREALATTDYDSEQATYILSDLMDALDGYAPEGVYFGSHPGDGADYGFWEHEVEWQELDTDIPWRLRDHGTGE